ncbi:MAG: J domain-containing protein [Methylophilaceae bacterium]|nr:J domain-containing protein [Methylophilaceae bacterium]
MSTLYEVLHLKKTATTDEIKEAYRVMAMKWHPDRNLTSRHQAEEKFKEIGAAYKALSDSVQRSEYDEWLEAEIKHSSQPAYSKTVDMSEKDAESLFFESMLDLAMELARRGHAAAAITKALMALDCPESIAKVVVRLTFQQ